MVSHLLRTTVSLVFTLTAFLLAATAAGAQDPSAPSTGSIRGSAFQRLIAGDTSSFEPLPYAIVHLVDLETGRRDLYLCGNEGHFAFADLPPGSYRLEARLEGYRSAQQELRVEAGEPTEAELVLVPGVDLEETLARLRSEDYESLIFQVFSPEGRSFRLELALGGGDGRMRLSEEIGDVGDGDFERKIPDEDLSRLRTLIDQVRPLERNHRGSYARPRDLPYETLEMAAAGLLAIVVVSGNPDFEEAAGRELIELLYSLSDQVVRRIDD